MLRIAERRKRAAYPERSSGGPPRCRVAAGPFGSAVTQGSRRSTSLLPYRRCAVSSSRDVCRLVQLQEHWWWRAPVAAPPPDRLLQRLCPRLSPTPVWLAKPRRDQCDGRPRHGRRRRRRARRLRASGRTDFFFFQRTFRAIHTRSQCTCELNGTVQRGCSGSAGRQAAGHRRARVVQDVLQMRRLRARHGGVDWRRPEQSGSKRVLHSHTEQAPPPPVPALGGSSSERSRSTQGSRTDELCDKAERLVVPSSAGLAREHAQPLRSSPKELRVGSALAAFGDGQGSTIPGGGRGLRAAITGKRRDQRHVAAQRFAELCGTICDEVEAPAIVRIDTRGRRPNEPLLRNDLALWSECFANDPYPRTL